MIFRRRTLNERLKQQAGLFEGSEDTRQPWDKAGIHGVHRPREWDDIATLAAELEGERAEFVVLDDEVIVEYGPRGTETFAAAISLEPPYRAEAVKREDGLWAVAARRIEVVTLPGVDGRELEQAHHDGERTLVIGELLEVGLEREDVLRLLGDPLEPAAFAGAQNLLESAQSRSHFVS